MPAVSHMKGKRARELDTAGNKTSIRRYGALPLCVFTYSQVVGTSISYLLKNRSGGGGWDVDVSTVVISFMMNHRGGKNKTGALLVSCQSENASVTCSPSVFCIIGNKKVQFGE